MLSRAPILVVEVLLHGWQLVVKPFLSHAMRPAIRRQSLLVKL